MQASGKAPVKGGSGSGGKAAVKAPAHKKETKAQIAGHKKVAAELTGHHSHESAKKRHAAAAKASKTRARRKAAAAKNARALTPGAAFDGCVITAVVGRLAMDGQHARLSDLFAAFRGAGGREEGGVAIEAMLSGLAVRGVIAGYRAVPLEPELLEAPGLILGVQLPGPHAVVTVPGPQQGLGFARWLSWGHVFDPGAEWPDAAVEEAWELWLPRP